MDIMDVIQNNNGASDLDTELIVYNHAEGCTCFDCKTLRDMYPHHFYEFKSMKKCECIHCNSGHKVLGS